MPITKPWTDYHLAGDANESIFKNDLISSSPFWMGQYFIHTSCPGPCII